MVKMNAGFNRTIQKGADVLGRALFFKQQTLQTNDEAVLFAEDSIKNIKKLRSKPSASSRFIFLII